MNRNITLMDGGTGTLLWNKAEKLGIAKVPVWIYNIEHPEIVEEAEREYVAAGSKLITTNTFSVNGPSVKRSSSYAVGDLVTAAVNICKKAIAGTDAKAVLDIGPLAMLLEPYGDLEEDECEEIYKEIMDAGVAAGADMILLETFLDLNMLEVAARLAVSYGLPVLCSMTFEKVGRTMMGNSVSDVIERLEPLGIHAVGMNCSLGPELALPIIREFSEKTSLPLMFKPNAGIPVSTGNTDAPPVDAATFAAAVRPAMDFVTYIGGCCGSDPSFIAALKSEI